MKKLFIILFALILMLSGCGWNIEIVDPTEQTSELKKTELEEKEEPGEITEGFIEEIVLNFGAEKEADGTYRVKELFSFYRNTGGYEDFQVIDESANFLYGMGAMLGKEYIEEIYVSDLRYEVYNAETFENIVYKYFGISADVLKNTIHYNEFEELGGTGYYWLQGPYYLEEDPCVTLENFEENADSLIINLKIDYKKEADVSGVLTVKLLPEGGYNYISYASEKIEGTEPKKVETLCFIFGSEPKEMKTGESYANWTFENAEALYNSDGLMKYVTAEFSADFDMVLVGYIERNPLFDLSENIFDFTPWAGDEGKIPGICNTPFTEKARHFMLDSTGGINIPELDYDERFPCKVTLNSYTINRGYTMTSDCANLVSFEPLLGKAKLNELQEEMILNFGAVKTDFGAIQAKKTGSLYFNTEGYEDLSKLGETSYFVWAMFHFQSIYDHKTQKELFSGAGEENGWAFPSEYYEPAVYKYFGVSAEELRKSEIYNAEKDYYNIVLGGGIGDTPFIIVNSVEETTETVVFHISLLHYFDENNADMALTVKLLSDGGYNYVSYLPE